MKKPQIDLIESFIAFIDSGSLVKASEQLHITQPALSMKLKRFEDFFDFQIFEFKGKKKELTPYGAAVYEESKKILIQIETSFENLHRRYSSSQFQTLKIGCRRELITKVSSSIQFNGCVSFFPMTSAEVLVNLTENKIDLGLGRILPQSNEIIAKRLFTSGTHIVIHKKWLKGTSLTKMASDIEKMKNIPALVYGDKAEIFKEWAQYMKMDFTKFQIKYRCEDWTCLLQLIEKGEGFSIMPDTVRSNLAEIEYFQIPQNLTPSHPHYFFYHKSLLKFPAFKNLFRDLK